MRLASAGKHVGKDRRLNGQGGTLQRLHRVQAMWDHPDLASWLGGASEAI